MAASSATLTIARVRTLAFLGLEAVSYTHLTLPTM